MYWYRIETNKAADGIFLFIGCSPDPIDMLVKRAQNGYFVRLDELLYFENGEVHEWADWDPTLQPTVFINPKDIISIMEFKGDPREDKLR